MVVENWKPVPEFEGLYEVSDLGNVRSLRKGIILKPSYSNSGGYPMVIFRRNKLSFARYNHRLVMEVFVGPCPDGLEVRHLDGNPKNPALTNLAYGTHAENMYDKAQHGTDHNVAKTHCPQGHEYSKENTYVYVYPKDGTTRRTCRICRDKRVKEFYARKRARTV